MPYTENLRQANPAMMLYPLPSWHSGLQRFPASIHLRLYDILSYLTPLLQQKMSRNSLDYENSDQENSDSEKRAIQYKA